MASVGRSNVTVTGTEEPESATPPVCRLGIWLDSLTRNHTPVPLAATIDAVTLNGITSPVDATLSRDEAGSVPMAPVVKLKVKEGAGAPGAGGL